MRIKIIMYFFGKSNLLKRKQDKYTYHKKKVKKDIAGNIQVIRASTDQLVGGSSSK